MDSSRFQGADEEEEGEEEVDAPLDELEPPWHYQRTREREEILYDRVCEVGELRLVSVDHITADLVRLDKEIAREEGALAEDLNAIIKDTFVPGGAVFRMPKTPKPRRFLELERRMSTSLSGEPIGDPTLVLSDDDEWCLPDNPVTAGRKDLVKKVRKLRAACWDLPADEARNLDDLVDVLRKTDELDRKVRNVLAKKRTPT